MVYNIYYKTNIMKERLEEINRMRRLMGLPLITEQADNKVILGEGIKPEDRVTDNNCIHSGTPDIVKTNYDFVIKHGYECLGRGVGTHETNIILKKIPENGNEYYVFIAEVPWIGDVGRLSYYFIKKDGTRGEGSIKNIDELPSIEQK